MTLYPYGPQRLPEGQVPTQSTPPGGPPEGPRRAPGGPTEWWYFPFFFFFTSPESEMQNVTPLCHIPPADNMIFTRL